MDQYGVYVWCAYGITLFVFLINLFLIVLEKHRVRKIIKTIIQST